MHSATAWAPYCGAAPLPGELLARWNFDPLLIAALAVATFAWAQLRKPSGSGRTSLLAALAVLLIAFVSPLCALSSALFSARTVHHLLLVAVAAPLLALAWGGSGRRIPLGPAAALHFLIFWLWHAPLLYGWALASDSAYWLMQASLLGSAAVFWAAALGSGARTPSVAIAFIAAIAQMGLLGALLTFAPAPLYAPHFATTGAWGLGALEDQQLAGLIMWVGSLPIYLAAAMAVLSRRLRFEAGEAAA